MPSAKEVLRRLYHDLVKRRARIRIVQARSDLTMEYPPIFLMGLYRSGTTLLRYVIDSHSHLCCPPESHFIASLAALVNDDQSRKGLGYMGFDQEHVSQKVRELIVYFFSNYAAGVGKPRWADKSPSYVDHLDFISRIFPEAQFVIIHRHPLDQIHSHTRGGTLLRPHLRAYHQAGEDFRLAAARYWQEKTDKLLRFAHTRRAQCLSTRYEDLCTNTEGELKAIFAFLDEPWEPQVLEFHRFEHYLGMEDGSVRASQGFLLRGGYYRRWPADLVEQCLSIVGTTMHKLGYSV